jgi:hypothetical protein
MEFEFASDDFDLSATEQTRFAEPRTIEDTGIGFDRLADLVLKTLYVNNKISVSELADQIALPGFLVQEIIDHLRQAKFCEVVVGLGHREQSQRFALTAGGRDQTAILLQRNRYVGPAPVPLDTFCDHLEKNRQRTIEINRARLEQVVSSMVIAPGVIDQIGPAICAGRSLFLYGAPGNGKTTLAEAISTARGGDVYIPYAVEAKGEIIRVFDPLLHQVVNDTVQTSPESAQLSAAGLTPRAQRQDRRWVRIKRPLIVAGGELTMESLELGYDVRTGIHQAPHQLKASGGTFLIDDFGRQRMRPSELLNRWIVPLEKACDYLHLSTGDVVRVPFDALLVFSTNLAPHDIIDEAFTRRIKYTVEMPNPTPTQFAEIFYRYCAQQGLEYDPYLVDYLIEHHYHAIGRPMRACHPRDIIGRIYDKSRYEGSRPTLDPDTIDWACAGYFLSNK